MKNSFIIWGLLFVVGCTSGNCRQNRKPGDQKDLSGAEAQIEIPSSAKDRVRVFKPDGSLQCNQGKKISLEKMKSDLKKIPVYSMERKNDGFMRTQVCGQETGFANVYEIDRSNLAEAVKLGFSEWTFN